MLARPASRTAASNGNSCSSRSSRGPMCAGAWLRPPSARPWPTMCLPVASTPVGEVRALQAADVGAARARPRGTGPRRRSPRSGPSADRGRCRGPAPGPGARRSRSIRRADRRGHRLDQPGSQAAAAPIDCWKHGASRASSPCRHSSWMIAGIPRRVSSTRKRWISLASPRPRRARGWSRRPAA